MIFSRFFSPAHTSSDPQKRLQAIAGLSVSKPAERSALHELAFNDSNSDVSLAALEKLDSFPLWMKMSQTARDEKIRRRAVARVESAIIDADSADISADDQYEYVLKQAPAELARKLLESPRRETLTDAQIFALLEKSAAVTTHGSSLVYLHLCPCKCVSQNNAMMQYCWAVY